MNYEKTGRKRKDFAIIRLRDKPRAAGRERAREKSLANEQREKKTIKEAKIAARM